MWFIWSTLKEKMQDFTEEICLVNVDKRSYNMPFIWLINPTKYLSNKELIKQKSTRLSSVLQPIIHRKFRGLFFPYWSFCETETWRYFTFFPLPYTSVVINSDAIGYCLYMTCRWNMRTISIETILKENEHSLPTYAYQGSGRGVIIKYRCGSNDGY